MPDPNREMAADPPRKAADRLGTRFHAPPAIPDHTLLQPIGAGSYGEVWLARNVLGTHRAVKIVWRDTFESERPYEREFRGIQKFEPVSRTHDGLVDILQIGRNDKDGCFYYVMELADDVRGGLGGVPAPLDGDGPAGPGNPAAYEPRTLRWEIERRGHLPFEETLKHLLSITGGLATLHEAGLIHRDIKPSNIIIVRGVAKLADIGLVAEASEGRSFVGTEGFIPPEGPGSVQGDIYSIGKVLYEAATGLDRLRFPSLPVNPSTGRLDETLLEINSIFLKACAQRRSDRYGSAEELRGDLLLLQGGRSVKKLRLLEVRLKFARRAGAVAGAVAVLSVAGLLAAGYRARVARENNDKLQALLERATHAEQSALLAERNAKDRLFDALAATGVGERRSGAFGRRFASLQAIVGAAEMRPGTPALRDAAITTLAMPDVRERRRIPKPAGAAAYCLSGDASKLCVANAAGGLRIAGVETGEDLFALDSTEPASHMYAGDSAGRWLVVVQTNSAICVWDLDSRRRLARCEGDYVVFPSADGRTLIEATFQGRLRLRDTRNGAVSDLSGEGLFDLVSRPQGRFAAAASRRTNNVAVVDLATGRIFSSFKIAAGDAAANVSMTPDGKSVVVMLYGGRALLYDLTDTSAPRLNAQWHTSAITYAQFHPDGDWCLTSGWDGTTKLVDAADGRVLAQHRGPTRGAAFTPTGTRAGLVDDVTGDIVLYDVAGRAACRVLGEPMPSDDAAPGPWNVSFLPDSRLLATSSGDGVRLFESRRGREAGFLPSTNWYAVCFSGEGALYAAGVHGLSRWPLAWAGPDSVAFGSEERIANQFFWHLHGSADGRVLGATAQREFTLIFPDRPAVHLPRRFASRGGFVSPDGRRIASLNTANSILIWDIASGAEVREIACAAPGGYGFSPDGDRIAIDEADAVAVYDIGSGRPLWRSPAPGSSGAAAWTPDGRLVAALRDGMVVHLFDAVTGGFVARLEHPEARPYNSITFSPNGEMLACASTAHVVHLWNLRVLRRELAALKLDWNQPTLPPAPPEPEPLVVATRLEPDP